MKYLFSCWDNLKKDIKNKNIFLFLDYDGTLTPIADTPDKAVISRKTKGILERLSRIPKFRLAIISGRALSDIKNLVGIEGIIYTGNHGLEIEGEKIKFRSPVFEYSKVIIRKIKNDLSKKISHFKGAFIEDKGLTLSLHYRLMDKNNISSLKNIFNDTIQPYLIEKKIRVTMGKKVLEVRPPLKWDKGKVVLWLLAKQRLKDEIFPIYLGDDVTDEDAFFALRGKGLTIFVGKPKRSYAQYYLRNTQEVLEFLERILLCLN
ncbi:MAG: trehalose-phosphatase [Candidatus Omnitrophica bacterium]|nr:trehalose-phosphatase [Candidatus Omnitrophota bacterium]